MSLPGHPEIGGYIYAIWNTSTLVADQAPAGHAGKVTLPIHQAAGSEPVVPYAPELGCAVGARAVWPGCDHYSQSAPTRGHHLSRFSVVCHSRRHGHRLREVNYGAFIRAARHTAASRVEGCRPRVAARLQRTALTPDGGQTLLRAPGSAPTPCGQQRGHSDRAQTKSCGRNRHACRHYLV